MLVDPANWAMVQSVCPGVIRDIDEEDLAECVRQVEAEYERQRHGFELSASVIGPLQRSLKEISS
jgi:hypothetical protein